MLVPYQFDFMRDALMMGMLVAIPCALLSCYIILKGWSLVGDAVSHAVLPGLVLSAVLGLPLLIGAFIAGLACATSVSYIAKRSRIKEDALLGIVFSGFFAVGLLLQSVLASPLHLDHILFGNLLGLNSSQLMTAALVMIAAIGFLVVRGRDLLLFCFDYRQAQAVGLSTGLLHFLLLAVLILTIVSALHAVGIILVIAMLIAPGATAFLITNHFGKMLAASVIYAIASTYVGITLSFYLDSAPAATIVLVMTGVFIITYAVRNVWLTEEQRVEHVLASTHLLKQEPVNQKRQEA